MDNKENNHVEKGKIQVKGKDKESKTATKLSKKKEEHTRKSIPGIKQRGMKDNFSKIKKGSQSNNNNNNGGITKQVTKMTNSM